ncbi:MAG: tripartite tricarboxylate transporter permease [Acetobacteraceae bacterium]|jgi:TctA family transporter
MHILGSIIAGFHVALTPANLLYCVIGATLGTVVGILPGLGPLTTIAMLLPITFKMPAVSALIMLSGIYYGAHHAASTTAIMLNMPGEPTSVVICFDGHPMARQGRAGPALCIAALSSFFAGCVAVLIIALFSPVLADIALDFSAPEYTSMMVLALVSAATLSDGPALTSLAMVVLGLLLGTVGTDINSNVQRFTFGLPNLYDGLDFVVVAVGLFAVAEIVWRLQHHHAPAQAQTLGKVRGLLPRREDLAASWKPILRGTALGGALGVLPGTGPLISSFASYGLERSLARDPTRFGNGAIEGVAGPEAANNAAALTHFIPMLTLGIPAGAANALMLGALIIQGITPGPGVMTDHADLFWGVVASMWIGNAMLLVLNLPLVGLWIRLLRLPYRLLYPGIIAFSCIGVYSLANSAWDVILAAGFGVAGYILTALGCRPAPLILGLVMGPLLEENLRRSLLISRGDPTILLTHPISAGFLALTVAILAAQVARGVAARRQRLSAAG